MEAKGSPAWAVQVKAVLAWVPQDKGVPDMVVLAWAVLEMVVLVWAHPVSPTFPMAKHLRPPQHQKNDLGNCGIKRVLGNSLCIEN